ncbi:protoporphyrinogen oxidase HemJ [Candidatus Pelagibacter sp. HIMB1321]|uniref:protoporphyrinogen oxidase HemJ n=1 Tax=Candidatus Pelagibacter sp. HIMB1321 TaxID=1388755 RepID=UPI000A07ECEB|nr:protoporphyrinogen oxidase HemJ [Candidatus Pelagibacter sp. HIMB1321]SMF80674.1 putative membrane protein [Candidatus Pelagibacter sp. HIMB1321]
MNAYFFFKSLHLISVISWMAGLLYLPRIFVYHSENMNKEEICTVFKTMERKLYNYIMMPAMLLSWIFGLVLISYVGIETLSAKWLQIKLVLVILLSIYHFYLRSLLLSFNENNNTKSSKFFRWLNEFPTLLLIIIVFIVIFKPI